MLSAVRPAQESYLSCKVGQERLTTLLDRSIHRGRESDFWGGLRSLSRSLPFSKWTPDKRVTSQEVRANNEHCGHNLGGQGLYSGNDREPERHPIGDGKINSRGRYPVSKLHLLRLFANHHQKHSTQHDFSEDQHFFIGQALVGDKGQNPHNGRQEESDEDSL